MTTMDETAKPTSPSAQPESSEQPNAPSASVPQAAAISSIFSGLAASKDNAVKKNEDEEAGEEDGDDGEVEASVDVQFEPVIKLEQVETRTLEEEEISVFKIRAKLFRFDKAGNEWKERGTGDVRLLQHSETKKIRLVMRRDKTLKVCANHLIVDSMKLSPNVGSDRSWVYTCPADVSDGESKTELFAIRFASSEHANLFKEHFDRAKRVNAGETDVPEITTQLSEDVRKEAKEKAAEAAEDAAKSASVETN